jgi:RNA polymerase sigma-70 factor, ECF subfamily
MTPDAVAAAYLEHAPYISRYVRWRIVDWADAEDIASAVWERQLIADASGDVDLSPQWLTVCARNAITDYYRRQVHRRADDLSEKLATHHNVERTVTNAITVQHILRLLPPRWATVLRLRYLEELSIEETAAVMGIPEGSVKSATSLAKAAARVLMGVDPMPPPRTLPHRNKGTRCKRSNQGD